jgi:hypothetical protein
MSFHQDLDNLTRDMHDKTWLNEYMKKNPVTAMLLQRKSLKFSGGKYYQREADTDTHESLAQDYTVNETLTHGTKDTTQTVKFMKKKFQVPIQIDVDEEMQNARQTSDGTQLHNLAKFRVRKANEACRVHLRKKIYASENFAQAPSDTNKYMQGLNCALLVQDSTVTYGGVTRTYSAGTSADTGFWWQPMGGTVSQSTQETATAISIAQLRTWQEPLEDLESDNTDLVSICGGVLWLSLQAEAEARSTPYKIVGNRVAKQGFTEMVLDGRRIVKDPFLKAANNSTMGETADSAHDLKLRFYSINLRDWDFFIHPDSNFRMTEFFDQKKIAGGTDMKLARIMFKGNLVCWHPQAQLYYANVTA